VASGGKVQETRKCVQRLKNIAKSLQTHDRLKTTSFLSEVPHKTAADKNIVLAAFASVFALFGW